ncbi:murein hydrolase activator EnvC family protein [Flavobacterium johnsoniae]|jgi:septal ring factor EnvC (AmiA/AmiB activator)|uniref:Septal ring factor EnvC, activator of murein hydrolases AmiA and AmiB n=2 Tax=Flavobacterium johnsoniae TaxID=986 RepID=A0A1M5HIX9_FLAJO|nr:peptidoglycan DD-metalloendopeptidase family protein [Flavobacterium johnsoniae]ABQ04100.1 Peptidase subfamily M23B-like protein [Flavobacterium johnsoniae UW101]OXG02666.1 peptidase M23 [Flavobacterium johnsoniae UW101]WQG79029.1 peptidoglycan DD-metalloendopeptidase family protein [Flavobacterium johnsoniae UW101]SHG15858.1 Septal ring factor EnvC, activator of murein hydrolases AmiA and AmiB [Flavobacterium johnsoniae]SHK12333.1 Septal ring factor EnvC, activator of murein hydrolases Ami
MPKFLLSLIFVCATTFVWAQDSQQEKLEQRKAQILQEIKDNEKMLQSVRKKEKSAVNEYLIQANKIKLKEKLINTTAKQEKVLSNDMYINQVQVNKLKKELAVLKEDYAKMILKSYKSRSEQSRAMFILSSESFLQAYKRAQYLKQYTNFRKNQGLEIQEKTAQLVDFNAKLDGQRKVKKKIIAENEKEKQSLEVEKKEQQKLVNSIKKDKNRIAADIKAKQSESKRIDRQIDRLIREAIAEANRKAAAEKAKENPGSTAAKAPVSSSKIAMTPEDKVLAADFKANRGRLPWPVEKGFISLGYGDQPHPLHPSITVHNSGVEITTEDGASARAVFAGEVSKVIVLSPVNKAVVIQHGDFFTVYQNLSSVSVSQGDKVSIKQNIGKVRTSGDTGKTIIKFLILQNTTNSDPENWLQNR